MAVGASDINVALEACLDRTACLVPRVIAYNTVGSWTWYPPAHLIYADFLVIGGGAGGAGGITSASGGGGGGGGRGAIQRLSLPAALIPVALSVTVGGGGAGGAGGGGWGVEGGDTSISGIGATDVYLIGRGGRPTVSSSVGGVGGFTEDAYLLTGYQTGGKGGAPGDPGGDGAHGLGTFGGAGGAAGGAASTGGQGFGAGGGGGGGGSGGGGGGGGAGGWGARYLTAQGGAGVGGTGNGGAGMAGYAMIVAWCGVEIT